MMLLHLPARALVHRAVDVPNTTRQSFWLQGAAWPFPGYDTADTFVDRLVRDPVVEAALHGHLTYLSVRSVQRRFLRATGLTQGAIRQIERA